MICALVVEEAAEDGTFVGSLHTQQFPLGPWSFVLHLHVVDQRDPGLPDRMDRDVICSLEFQDAVLRLQTLSADYRYR